MRLTCSTGWTVKAPMEMTILLLPTPSLSSATQYLQPKGSLLSWAPHFFFHPAHTTPSSLVGVLFNSYVWHDLISAPLKAYPSSKKSSLK